MNKKSAIALIIILLVLGVGVWWFFLRGEGGGGGGGGTGGGGFIGKLSDALSSGKAMKCTVDTEDSKGTFYVKSGMLAGNATSEGQSASFLIKDSCMYYWQEGNSQGYKWCWEAGDESYDWEENLMASSEQYNCQPASVSNSMFDVPSGVSFTDYGSYSPQ